MPKEKGKRFTQEEISEIRAQEKLLKAEVEGAGYTIMWTHYYREDDNSLLPVFLNDKTIDWVYGRKYAATSCCLLIGDSCVSRGFTICSYEDQPLKTYGRLLSLKRAFDSVENDNYPKKHLSRKGCNNIDIPIWSYSRMPQLTSIEASRIAKVKPCEACRV